MHPIHPMVVHFPIALLLASVFFDLIALRWRGPECRATSLSLLALGVLAALVALLTGHLAEEAIEHGGMVPKQAIETHEELAFAAFWVFAGLLGVKMLSSWGWMRERALLVLFLGVGGAVLLFVASYYGGDLVYRYGAGVLPR